MQFLNKGNDQKITQLETSLADIVHNVKSFGATGGSNDSTAFQATNDALVARGGGILLVPAGTWYANFILDSKVRVLGEGINVSIIKSVAGSNADVIKGRNFDTLIGSAKATPENRGVRWIEIKDITIDGNKANNTSGYGIRLWGCSWKFQNVIVQNCANDGIYTEFTTHDSPSGLSDPSTQALESSYKNIHTLGNGGNGWTYKGPHDSMIENFIAFGNTGYALKTIGIYSSLSGKYWNSWMNGNSYYFSSAASVDYIIASGAYVGTGIEIEAGVGSCKFTNLTTGGHVTGMILRGSTHLVQGEVSNCRNAANDAGDGIVLDGVLGCNINIIGTGNHNVIKKNPSGETGINFITAVVNVSNSKTMVSGVALNVANYLSLISCGTVDYKKFNIPTRNIDSENGWTPVLPQSNGVILTDDMTPTTTKRGGVLKQAAITDLTATPTMGDFNGLLAKLRSSGLLT